MKKIYVELFVVIKPYTVLLFRIQAQREVLLYQK